MLKDELIARRPCPEIIYQYRSNSGLLRIAETKSLSATSIHYMNDSAEFAHAISITNTHIWQLRQRGDSKTVACLDYLQDVMERIRNVYIYVSSFSEMGDLLSQWRGYCPNGFGCCIGFKSDLLIQAGQRQGFTFYPCIYDQREQDSFISNLLNRVVRQYMDWINLGHSREKTEEATYRIFVADFMQLAAVFKHPAFAEEREWRLVSGPTPLDHPQVKYRAGETMIVPYFQLELVTSGQQLALASVRIGPNQNKALALTAATNMLSAKGISWGQAMYSEAPYRGNPL